MAGPSLSGPLTGWTSVSLMPKTPVPNTPAPTAWDTLLNKYRKTPEERAAAFATASEAAQKAEAEAKASGDPKKLQEAFRLWSAANAVRGVPEGQTYLQSLRQDAESFRSRNPDYQFNQHLENLLAAPVDKLSEAVFGVPASDAPAPRAPMTMTRGGAPAGASGNLSQYDLTADELGGGLGPNPRSAGPPQTPLETLLASIYPDAAAAGGAAVDPRNPNQPSVFNNVLANMAAEIQGGGPNISGFVPGPMVPGGTGAQIASTIPGAPPFLAGAINNLGGGGFAPGGMVAAPVARPAFDPLVGISAISAEQRIQAADLARQKAERQASWEAQMLAQQRAQQQRNQILRQQAGPSVSVSGWQAPTFQPVAWTPTLPSY